MNKSDSLDSVIKQPRGIWLQHEDADVYLRYTYRLLPEIGKCRTLELASCNRESRQTNIEYDANAVSTGFMNRLINEIETLANGIADAVYIENVLNEFLPYWFVRRGYTEIDGSMPLCFYRLTEKLNSEVK